MRCSKVRQELLWKKRSSHLTQAMCIAIPEFQYGNGYSLFLKIKKYLFFSILEYIYSKYAFLHLINLLNNYFLII